MNTTRVTSGGSYRAGLLFLCIGFVGVACNDAKPTKQAEKVVAAPPTLPTGPSRPVRLENLGLVLDAPDGASASTEEEMKDRYAHVEVGALMINVFAVDEYSTPSFAKARQVPGGTKLIRDIRGEETTDGWIDIKELERTHDASRRIEVSVRRTLGTTKWDCGVATSSDDLANMVVAACKSLRVDTGASSDWAAGLGASGQASGKGSAAVENNAHAPAVAAKPKAAASTRAIDKASISRVVVPKARVCYERALLANPGLQGTVTVKFVIAATGKVESATATGMNEPSVESCIAKAFTSAVFPAPSDGKKVIGSYPFVFKPN